MAELDNRNIRNMVIDECAEAIPTTWLDPLLRGSLPARETEALLRGIQDRIRGLRRE